MKSVRIEHNSQGWSNILQSDAVKSLIESEGDRIAETAGEGFVRGDVRRMDFGGGRWGCYVWAETYEAMADEAENGTLTRAALS